MLPFDQTHAGPISRRSLLQLSVAALASSPMSRAIAVQTPSTKEPAATSSKTKFQIACMTLPYNQYPLDRALSGIQSAGYEFVAWGTTHKEAGESKGVPVMPADAPPHKAKELAARCRHRGLTPLMMFSGIYPEAPNAVEVLTHRFRQAQAAGIPQVLTFGHTNGPNRNVWVERFRKLGPIARDHGVLLVVKQHGETGATTGEIVREVADPNIQVNYDAGNVMDYTRGKVNPLDDIKACADSIRSFCIKDHRLFPVDQDCGPGLGEIDHYRLLHTVAFTSHTMPLCCENISAPKLRPTRPEDLDALARRAREFLETVIAGLHG